METKQEVSLEILKDKKVQVLITTVYLLDGEEIASKNFRVCLDVGEIDNHRSLFFCNNWAKANGKAADWRNATG